MCFFNQENGNLFVFTNFLKHFALWTSPSFYLIWRIAIGSFLESCDSCPEKDSCWCNALSACWALLLQLAWSAYKRSFIVSACVVCCCLATLEAVQCGRRKRTTPTQVRSSVIWFGHVSRMPQERLFTKQFLLATPTGKRPRGCPRARWSDYTSDLALGASWCGVSSVILLKHSF